MSEFWLQKKTLGGWSHVTYYTDLQQALESFKKCIGNGYSWRLVRVETVCEHLLDSDSGVVTSHGNIRWPEPAVEPQGDIDERWDQTRRKIDQASATQTEKPGVWSGKSVNVGTDWSKLSKPK